MTTYAPTFTSRWRGQYKCGGIQHTLQLRGPRGASFATMDGYKDRASELFNNFTSTMYSDFVWLGASVALTDSEEFIPSTLPGAPTVGAIDPSTVAAVTRIKGLTFSGAASGSRAKFTLFGIRFSQGLATDIAADGLVTPAEYIGIGNVRDIANTYFYTNSGALAGWHNRATYKENDHLLKLVRRGTIS